MQTIKRSRKDCKEPRVITVPKERSRLLWLSDIHFPHHDTAAITMAVSYGDTQDVDVIVLGGDLLDNTPFSRHGHVTKDEDIKPVFDMAIRFFEHLRERFPAALIYWLEGNHDKWFYTYIKDNARVLQNDPYFTLEKRLRLEDYGIIYLPETHILKFADLGLHHGHLFFRGKCLPNCPARTVYSKVNASMLCGHVHKQSAWVEKTYDGKRLKTYTTGCLSELTPAYSPFANYSHGFAYVKRGEKGRAVVRNFVIDGEIED